MTWVKLDDQFFRHPKSRAAGKDGRALDLAGLCYCASALTDGFISKAALPLIAAEAEVRPSVVTKLVEVGRWEEVIGGWLIHNYDKRQRTRDEVEGEREATRERVKRHRDRHRRNGVTPSVSNGKVTASESDTETETHQQPCSEPLHPQAVDDDYDIRQQQPPLDITEVKVRAVFERCADAKTEGIAPRSPNAYRTRVLDNLEREHGAELRTVIASHPDAPVQTLAGWILGEPNSLNAYRRADAS